MPRSLVGRLTFLSVSFLHSKPWSFKLIIHETKLILFTTMTSTMMLTMYPAKKNEADDPAKFYLKNASIEYKCTLASGTPSGLDIIYTNESAGLFKKN